MKLTNPTDEQLDKTGQRCLCKVWLDMSQTRGADRLHSAFSDTPARAGVIALLRAHGVEVVFT